MSSGKFWRKRIYSEIFLLFKYEGIYKSNNRNSFWLFFHIKQKDSYFFMTALSDNNN